MSITGFIVVTFFVACLLLAAVVIVRGLERTRHSPAFEGMFRDAYAKAPESAVQDDADGEEG